MYKFFVTENQISNGMVEIIEEDVNHIKNVLRLEVDEKIQVCNMNNSTTYLCKINQIESKFIICEVLEKIETTNEPSIYLHIFQGLPKAEKMETIIQKTTELGVTEITPLILNRCVVKFDEKTSIKKNERWIKIAKVAAKQSKRDRIPKINLPIDIKKIYEKVKDYDIVLVAYENEQKVGIKEVLKNAPKKDNLKIAVIVGPEGGIEENEIRELEKIDVKAISLGKRILRTETAPIVLTSVIMYEFNEMF